ncbi:MAG: heme-binding protein [Verrucomicrobiota bacterium]
MISRVEKFITQLITASLLLCVQRSAAQMSVADVEQVIAQARTRAGEISSNSVIAVVDREGFVLGVWAVTTNSLTFDLDVEDAIAKAGTAGFLSSDQHAFTSRTAGFIVQQNFPPGVKNKPTGPLVGVNFSNLSFSDVNRFKNPSTYSTNVYGGGGTNGGMIGPVAALSGLAGSPGGVPLFKNGRLIGGVGVAGNSRRVRTGIPALDDIQLIQRRDVDEDVALAGQTGFRPAEKIFGSHVFIDGIRIPYVKSGAKIRNIFSLTTNGNVVADFPLIDSPLVSYPTTDLGGIIGEVRAPITSDPIGGDINGAARLTAGEVTSILTLAAQRANITRAGIRLPRGQRAQVFISVVNNPNADGIAPTVLGTFRTPDATIFSWDVSVQKARTALYFSEPSRNLFSIPDLAMSARTVAFLAQAHYPPGIKNTAPGPFLGLQEFFSAFPPSAFPPVPLTNILNGVTVTNAPAIDPNLPNGITIFPGGFPLYRNGVLIGAIGVSGDGIDQDDIIAASGTVNFLPPGNIRADQFRFRGARLPYAKFPRNPSL